MDQQLIIDKIIAASRWDLLFTKGNYKKEYVEFMKHIHPDICNLPLANDAVSLLNKYKEEMERLTRCEDDAGFLKLENGSSIVISGEKGLLAKSYANNRSLRLLSDPGSIHFQKYLPEQLSITETELAFPLRERTLPLTGYVLPQEHVAWILSRMFEFTAWLHQEGFCHAGINPESVWVVPEVHGVVFATFYHMTKMGTKLESLSGRYLNWYPQVVFDSKQAIPYLDLSLVQRTGLYLLGDPSGNGVKLKKTCNEQLIDFLITPHFEAFQTYNDYRALLHNIFGKPKFHTLNI